VKQQAGSSGESTIPDFCTGDQIPKVTSDCTVCVNHMVLSINTPDELVISDWILATPPSPRPWKNPLHGIRGLILQVKTRN
jgi:hypothetical protein